MTWHLVTFHALEVSAEGNYLVISARDTFAAKERLQGLAFLRTKGSHTAPLQHQGQHRIHGVITRKSHFCFLVLIPSFKKDLECARGKQLNIWMCASWCSAKRRHSHSAPLAFNHNIAQAHGRSQSKFSQRQTIMGNCSQRSHPNCLVVSRSKRREWLLCNTSWEVLISWRQCLAEG